jgi:Asp-tRNA(Asn)/Glu-tRNA(Gln) amidotransferase B subunit
MNDEQLKAYFARMYGKDRSNAIQRYQRHEAINTTHQMRKLPHLTKQYNSAHDDSGMAHDVHFESAYGHPEESIGSFERKKHNAKDHFSFRQPDMPLSDAPDHILEKYLNENPFIETDKYRMSTDDLIGHVESAEDILQGTHKPEKIYPPNTLRDLRDNHQ